MEIWGGHLLIVGSREGVGYAFPACATWTCFWGLETREKNQPPPGLQARNSQNSPHPAPGLPPSWVFCCLLIREPSPGAAVTPTGPLTKGVMRCLWKCQETRKPRTWQRTLPQIRFMLTEASFKITLLFLSKHTVWSKNKVTCWRYASVPCLHGKSNSVLCSQPKLTRNSCFIHSFYILGSMTLELNIGDGDLFLSFRNL